MLRLTATEAAKATLRAVRDRNPGLFSFVSERITALREDPEPKQQGRTFRLDDGRTAHLATFYDNVHKVDLVLVWVVEEIEGEGVLSVIAFEPAE